ncbi:MAG: hypothetical protein D6715_05375 [Calditrichaeota bacterium]|nr:MAG: hypothetical protein D6715_05375 [Calditrichota bacterium]
MSKKWHIWILVPLGLAVVASLAALFLEPLGQSWATRFGGVFFYLMIVAAVLALLQRSLGKKLQSLPPLQQWVVRTLIYAGAMVSTLWVIYLLQVLAFLPWPALQQAFQRRVWVLLAQLVSRPFNPGAGDLFADPRWQSIGAALLFVSLGVALISVLISYVQVRWQESRHRQARQQAELTALRAQMNPHFLFNTLNTIASFIRQDPERAEKLLIELSNLFRYLFQQAGQEMVSLEAEVAFARRYVALLQARFADRLRVHWQVDSSLAGLVVPGLLFQPLIENAVQHGWPDRQRPLEIWIEAQPHKQGALVRVRDNGCGFDPDRRKPLRQPNHALSNLAERLRLLYGDRKLLEINSRPGQGTQITIQIPERAQP